MREIGEGIYRVRELEAQRTATITPYADSVSMRVDQPDISGDPYTIFSIAIPDVGQIARLHPEFERIQEERARVQANRAAEEQEVAGKTRELVDALGALIGSSTFDVETIEEGRDFLGLSPKWTLLNSFGSETGSFMVTKTRANLRFEHRRTRGIELNFSTPTFWSFIDTVLERAT